MISMSWNRSGSIEEQLKLDPSRSVARHLPLSSLGYGVASLQHKAANFCQKLMMEVGTTALFNQFRNEVVGYTSDGGVDFGVVDASILSNDSVQFEQWWQLIDDIKENRVSPVASDGAAAYLFHRALGMPDHLHILFDACVKDAVVNSMKWKPFESALHDISVFLVRADLKTNDGFVLQVESRG